MPRRLLPVGVLMVWMSMGLLIHPAGAGEKPAPKETSTDASASTDRDLVSDIIILDSKRMSAEQIKVRLRTQVGKDFDPAALDEDVRELYKTNQFSNIQTFTEPDRPGRVKVRMHFLDLPNKVQKVTFLGAKHLKEEELRTLTCVRIGMPLNPNLNRAGCQKILDKYAEQGRSFASCELIKGGQLDDTEVVYSITEGPKVKVRDIQFIGNSVIPYSDPATRVLCGVPDLATQIQISRSWSRFRGSTYSRQVIEAEVQKSIKHFETLGYTHVKVSLETRPSADGCEITLIFHVQEGPCSSDWIKEVPECPMTRLIRAFSVGNTCGRDKTTLRPVSTPSDQKGTQPGVCQVQYQVDDRKPAKTTAASSSSETKDQPPARIGQIILTGNKRISSESILAHVPLFPGQVLTYPDLQRAENALVELGLFVVDPASGVRPTITVLDSGSAYKDILITVKEKPGAGKSR